MLNEKSIYGRFGRAGQKFKLRSVKNNNVDSTQVER